MFKKIICFILIIKLSTVCGSFVPIFFGHDSAVIVDADNNAAPKGYHAIRFPKKIMPAPFPIWRHYPRYHIIPPQAPPLRMLPINPWARIANQRFNLTYTTPAAATTPAITSTTSTTTTSTTPRTTISKTSALPPILQEDEFPAELLDIAQNKLGLRSLDEIPSISELSQILGTNSPQETLQYIKNLASNEQGIALMKAYIESADYTDKTSELVNKNYEENETEEREEEENEEVVGDTEETINANDEGLVVVTDEDLEDDNELNEGEDIQQNNSNKIIEPMPENNQSIMGRLANYMNINKLFDEAEEKTDDQMNRITENGKKIQTIEVEDKQVNSETKHQPTLVKDSMPFNYPIPIRAQTSTTSTTVAPASVNTTVVHLNTPKVLIPHMQKISLMTKIPTKQIEDYVASKPKLLDLITKVSRFPIGYERNSAIEAQVVAAVQKALEQDEDLMKILSSKATLK